MRNAQREEREARAQYGREHREGQLEAGSCGEVGGVQGPPRVSSSMHEHEQLGLSVVVLNEVRL